MYLHFTGVNKVNFYYMKKKKTKSNLYWHGPATMKMFIYLWILKYFIFNESPKEFAIAPNHPIEKAESLS